MNRIMLVDDDLEMRSMLRDYLVSEGHKVVDFGHPEEALRALLSGEILPLVLLTDLQMPEMSGVELMKRAKVKIPHLPVIVMTAFGSIQSAVEAMRKGAFDYVTKPFKLAELTYTLDRALQMAALATENESLRAELKKSFSKGSLLGKSKPMREVFELLERLAPAQSSVLISGESGTGKEVVARTLHALGPRAAQPFIAINCTAIPEALLESELFGHAKGAFTGADRRKKGLFEEAQGGTLFLDEIGDMPPALQAKLLRVLQERRIHPVGENKEIELDVRVLAATHKDLRKAIREGQFREDLFYRLNVIPVNLPPLRHRKEDIPLLAQNFLLKFASLNRSKAEGFTPSALHMLVNRSWPGNVRELENMVERLVVMTRSELIDESEIPTIEDEGGEDFYGQAIQGVPTLEEMEKRYIEFILMKTGGKKDRTSQILGISRRTLYRKEREFGFVSSEDEEPEDSM